MTSIPAQVISVKTKKSGKITASLNEPKLSSNPIIVRTSDRTSFKRCRRQWNWSSEMREGRMLRFEPEYFWFGSGIHFALEDYHGYNKYGHPGKAFMAYVKATVAAHVAPPNWQDHQSLALCMLCYYADKWLQNRDPLNTLWLDGKPQVEVFEWIDLGLTYKGRPIYYSFTLDRVIHDEYGGLYVVEYKSNKAFRTQHFEFDEQVSAYVWAASLLYKSRIEGTIYQQFKKDFPTLPRILSNGSISTDKRQPTTSSLYRHRILQMYGNLSAAPRANREFLEALQAKETEDVDNFIVRHRLERSVEQAQSCYTRIVAEISEMVREDVPLYPHFHRDCSWDCPWQVPCLACEDGGDFEAVLKDYSYGVNSRNSQGNETWTNLLPPPESLVLPPEEQLYSHLSSEDNPPQESNKVSPESQFLEGLGLVW